MSSSLDDVAIKLSDIIKDYADDVKKLTEEKLDKTADDILNYIVANCPRGKSNKHLADSFVKTEIGSGANKVIYISSKTKGSLVHLVELGFKHRSGKHVPARPFLRPAYDNFTPKMLEEIKNIIKEGTR